ncbi:hypothetical protein [Kitasatospora sp. NPDC004531]
MNDTDRHRPRRRAVRVSRTGREGSRRSSGRYRLRVGLLLLLSTAALLLISFLGGRAVYEAADDLTYQAGWRGIPHLRMAVDDCWANPVVGRKVTFDCAGRGGPAGAVPAEGRLRLSTSPVRYSPGTVLEVNCVPTGRCLATGPGQAFGDGAGLAIGCWLFSFTPGLGLMAVSAHRSTERRSAGEAPSAGFLARPHLLQVWFIVPPVLALLMEILSISLGP